MYDIVINLYDLTTVILSKEKHSLVMALSYQHNAPKLLTALSSIEVNDLIFLYQGELNISELNSFSHKIKAIRKYLLEISYCLIPKLPNCSFVLQSYLYDFIDGALHSVKPHDGNISKLSNYYDVIDVWKLKSQHPELEDIDLNNIALLAPYLLAIDFLSNAVELPIVIPYKEPSLSVQLDSQPEEEKPVEHATMQQDNPVVTPSKVKHSFISHLVLTFLCIILGFQFAVWVNPDICKYTAMVNHVYSSHRNLPKDGLIAVIEDYRGITASYNTTDLDTLKNYLRKDYIILDCFYDEYSNIARFKLALRTTFN